MERRLDSTMTSFAEQTELLVPFATFHTAVAKELQMELIIPFWTIRSAETEEGQTELFIPFRTFHATETSFEHTSSLRRWIEAHEYSFERSWSLISDESNLIIRFVRS